MSNLSHHFVKTENTENGSDSHVVFYFEIDGVIYEPYKTESAPAVLEPWNYRRHFVRGDVARSINDMIEKEKCDIQFISTYYTAEEKAAKEEIVRDMVPGNHGVILLPIQKYWNENYSKAKWAEEQGTLKSGILLDPVLSEIFSWKEAGGTAVFIDNSRWARIYLGTKDDCVKKPKKSIPLDEPFTARRILTLAKYKLTDNVIQKAILEASEKNHEAGTAD